MSLGFEMVVGHGTWWGPGGCGPSTAAGKSAVQLLQESKSRYVKSGRVLGSRQAPSRPDHLHISANPNIFLSAPAHTLHPHSQYGTSNGVAPSAPPPPVPPRQANVAPLTVVALAQHSGPSTCGISLPPPPPLPARSPRGASRPRAKTQPVGEAVTRGVDLRRSLSHGPADRAHDDVQMKLRRLLSTDSRESLAPQLTSNEGDMKDPPNGTFRAEVVSVGSHKSLPDLAEAGAATSLSGVEPRRHPSCSCPGAIALDTNTQPPPRPPRRSLGEYPPKVPAKPPPPRPPPPKLPAGRYIGDEISSPPGKTSPSTSCTDEGGALSMVPASSGRRRPILRSKSDVTHERSLGCRWDEGTESRRSSYCSAELEAFFDSMGLDGSTLRLVSSPLTPGTDSPPVYFDEQSSEESFGHLPRRESEDDSDDIKSHQAAAVQGVGIGVQSSFNFGRRITGEPSIVEKNARVIKWLFNCQRARSDTIPRSLSSGS